MTTNDFDQLRQMAEDFAAQDFRREGFIEDKNEENARMQTLALVERFPADEAEIVSYFGFTYELEMRKMANQKVLALMLAIGN